jgi:hypothetical protein
MMNPNDAWGMNLSWVWMTNPNEAWNLNPNEAFGVEKEDPVIVNVFETCLPDVEILISSCTCHPAIDGEGPQVVMEKRKGLMERATPGRNHHQINHPMDRCHN